MAVKNSSGPDEELECANGFHCDEAKASVSLMHWFQVSLLVHFIRSQSPTDGLTGSRDHLDGVHLDHRVDLPQDREEGRHPWREPRII
jgi:hypothetical protein